LIKPVLEAFMKPIGPESEAADANEAGASADGFDVSVAGGEAVTDGADNEGANVAVWKATGGTGPCSNQDE
jgi:hypothetical protein